MKRISFFCSVFACLTVAAATVEQKVVRQRWPWSPKVDVDFVLSGTDASGLTFEVAYEGSDGWVELKDAALSGDFRKATPGEHHVTWDPLASGIGTNGLSNLQVRIEPYSFESRKFLVLDLRNKTYEYMSEPPEGGWNQDIYKTSKMPFRRIPAGTYTLGHPSEDIVPYQEFSVFLPYLNKGMGVRQVTISSDYYIAVFPTTTGQFYFYHNYLDHFEKTLYAQATYAEVRGKNWPLDKFSVNSGSDVELMRRHCNNEFLVDLPTAAQFEVAMRAGATTILPNGGTGADTVEAVKALFEKLSPLKDEEKEVGLRDANNWGIYNTAGMTSYLTLDAISCSEDVVGYPETNPWKWFLQFVESGADPIGRSISDASDRRRISMFGGWHTGKFADLSGYRNYVGEDARMGIRFCIHLDPTIAD